MEDLAAQLKLPSKRVYVKDAGIFKRLLAFVADLFLLDLFVFANFEAIITGERVSLAAALNGSFTPGGALYASIILMALLALTYFLLFEYLLGQTPGMMLLNIQAANVTLWRALVRNLYFLPLFPFPLLWVIEPLYLLFRKRRLLEELSGTRTLEQINY